MEWFYRTESKEEYSFKRPQGLKLAQLMQREGKTFVKIHTSASAPAPLQQLQGRQQAQVLQPWNHRARCDPQTGLYGSCFPHCISAGKRNIWLRVLILRVRIFSLLLTDQWKEFLFMKIFIWLPASWNSMGMCWLGRCHWPTPLCTKGK